MSFNFIAFDLETTGVTPGIDRIVEVGAVRFSNFKPVEKFVSLVDPLVPISKVVSDINGITDDMVQGKPSVDEILPKFTEFCGSDILVAHNAPFDYQFLLEDLKKYETPGPTGTLLDTYQLSKKLFPGRPNYKLESLSKWIGVDNKLFHRAEQDAICCGCLFTHILKTVFKSEEEIELQNLINLTGKDPLKFPKIKKNFKQMDLFK